MNRNAIKKLCTLSLLPAAISLLPAAQAAPPGAVFPDYCMDPALLTPAEQAECTAAGYGGAATPPPLAPPVATCVAQAICQPPAAVDVLGAPLAGVTANDLLRRMADAPRRLAGSSRERRSQGLRWQWAGGADETSRDAMPGLSGFRVRAETLSVGADQRLSDTWAVGGALAMTRSRTHFDRNDSAQQGSSDNLTLYAQWNPWSALSLSMAASGEQSAFNVQRDGGTGAVARSSPRGSGSGLSLMAGYDLASGAWSLSPYCRWDQAHVRIDAFQESGSSDALAVTAQGLSSRTLTAGANVQWSVPQPWGLWLPYVRLEMSSRQDRPNSGATGTLLSDNSALLIPGAGDERNRFGALALGFTVVTQRATTAFFDVQTGFAQQGYRIQRLGAGLRFEL
jgi:outer membrane autotransporter protein